MKGKKAPGVGKAGGKKKLLIAAAAAAVLAGIFFLRGGGKDAPPPEEQGDGRIPAPVSYSLGGLAVTALPALGEDVAVYPVLPAGEDAAADAGEQDAAAQEEDAAGDGPLGYRYQGLTAPGALTGAYAALLSTPDAGFYVADEQLAPGQAPDFEAGSGSVVLARMLPEPEAVPAEITEDMTEDQKEVAEKRAKEETYQNNARWEKSRLTLALSWEGDSCTVTAEIKEVPRTASNAGQGLTKLTVPDAGAYIQTLSPAAFGLEGTSMEDYRVYVADGSVMVNGLPCLRVNICYGSGSELAGNYFLSADRRVIYQLDAVSGTVELLEPVSG